MSLLSHVRFWRHIVFRAFLYTLALTFALCASAATPPAGARVLSCTLGGNTYLTVAPGAGVSMNVSPNPSGQPSLCGLPASFPQTYYVKTTVDGGKSWQWAYKLSDFGYPSSGGNTPPPVTPTCPKEPDQWVTLTWSCAPGNGVMTCTAPITGK